MSTDDRFRTWANAVGFAVLVVVVGVILLEGRSSQKQQPEPVTKVITIPTAEELYEVCDKKPDKFTLVAVGDVMLARGVGKTIQKMGADFPFRSVSGLLRGADLAFANLECSISCLGTAKKGKEVVFRADPRVVDGLRDAGIDIVSVANNHATDYGSEALLETLDILSHNGIVYIGGGANSAAAHRTGRFTVNGLRVLFLGYSYKFDMVVEAKKGLPGVAIAPAKQIALDIEEARKSADVVIVSFHWGWEYSDHPDQQTRALAHLAVEAGADVVIGHHPHVIQGVETYKGALICYSLGNFIFDQHGIRVRRGLMLRCILDRSGFRQANLMPVVIDASEYRPALATGEAARPVLLELKRLSKQLDTELELKGDMAIIRREKEVLIGTKGNTEGAD